MESDEFEVDAPVGVELLLPLLQKCLKHQNLITSDISLRVDLCKLSISYICITFLWLRSTYILLIEFREVLLKIDTLLKPLVTSPCHGHLIEVFKQGDKSDEVGVLKELLLDDVEGDFDILEMVPFE